MTKGKFATDRTVGGIDYPRMREYRLNRALEQMKKDGLGTLVVWENYDIRYISGFYITIPTKGTEGSFVILMRDGEYYVNGLYASDREVMLNDMPWIRGRMIDEMVGAGKFAHTAADVEPFVNFVAKLMAKHGVSNEPVGLAGSTSGLLLGEAFKAKGIETIDARATMFEARKIKNQDEVECVRMACSNAEAAFADIVDAIRPGVTECEIVGVGMKTLYTLGADETQEFVCASGQRTNPLHIDYTDRQIRPGDLVIVDINGNSWQGYKSCYYRTFCCGKASQEQKENYEICRKMMYDAMGVIKAGNTTADIGSKFPDSPKFWGYDEWTPLMGGWAMGHGIGISLHEMPMIGRISVDNPVKLEEGMVLAIETWYGKKDGKDGVRLEEDLVVTKDSYDLLTKFPVNELTECWI